MTEVLQNYFMSWGNLKNKIYEKNCTNYFLGMYVFSYRNDRVSIFIEPTLKEIKIKDQRFLKWIILVIISIILALILINGVTPLYLGALGIAIITWVTVPS